MIALHVVMLPVLAILFVVSRLNVRVGACPQDDACNQAMLNAGAWMLDWLPILIFVASIVATVVLWRRQRRVFWVAVVALTLIAVVFVTANLLISAAW